MRIQECFSKPRALLELEREFRERGPCRGWLLLVPAFRPLYSDPRFQALVQQMGLPRTRVEHASSQPEAAHP